MPNVDGIRACLEVPEGKSICVDEIAGRADEICTPTRGARCSLFNARQELNFHHERDDVGKGVQTPGLQQAREVERVVHLASRAMLTTHG